MSDPATLPELLAEWDQRAAYNLAESKKYRTNCNKDQRGLRIGQYTAYTEAARQLRAITNGTDTH